MTVPAISVLMPVYNAERYVAAAVESILEQTFSDFEFIIIDDGSSDGSSAILQSFARRDCRIRLTSRPNTGYARALNEGLARSRGVYLARMDADDVSLPQRFEKQYAFLQSHADCHVVGCGVSWVDCDGAAYYDQQMPLIHEEIEARLLQGLGAMSHPGAMIRLAPLVELGGYREEFYGVEDHDLWLRMAERGRLANVPEMLLQGRVHGANFTFANDQRNRTLLRAVLAEAYDRRGLRVSENLLSALPPCASEMDRLRSWAWSAVQAGHFRTARKHAFAILRRRFSDKRSWTLLAYALLGSKAERLRRVYRRIRGLAS